MSSPEVRATIWDHRLAASMGALWDGAAFRELTFDSYFAHTPLRWNDTVEVGPFRIRARRTIHHVPNSALLIEAAGRKLGFSSDTAFDPEPIAFLNAADLIVHETNYGPAHTPYAALAALPAETRTRTRLIHYPDTLDLGSSVMTPLHEGQVLEV